MRLSGIVTFVLTGQLVLASVFFKQSKSDRIRNHLEGIGYEVIDSAGNLKDSVLDSLDPESLKDWLDFHGIAHSGDQLAETAKKHKDVFLSDVKEYAASSHHTAADLLNKGKEFYATQTAAISDSIVQKWSDSRLKEFLDARGYNVPQGSKRDELLALVARAKHKLPVNFNGPTGEYWFDGWSREDLTKKLQGLGESIEGSRKDLVKRLQKSYAKSYEEGKAHGEGTADKVKSAYGDFKGATHDTFSKWSVEDLKDYLSDFGTELKEGKDNLVKAARDNYDYFIHGERPPTAFERVKHHLSGVSGGIRDYFSRLFGVNAFLRSDL